MSCLVILQRVWSLLILKTLEPAVGKTRKLGNRPANQIDAARMLKRPAQRRRFVGCILPPFLSSDRDHEFLENGGSLEVAQRIADMLTAGQRSSTTPRGQKVLLEDMERIGY